MVNYTVTEGTLTGAPGTAFNDTSQIGDFLSPKGYFAEQEMGEFLGSETAQALRDVGQDPEIAWNRNSKIQAEDDPEDITEAAMLNPDTETGKAWLFGSKIMHEYFKQLRNPVVSTVSPGGIAQDEARPLSQQAYSTAAGWAHDLGEKDIDDVSVSQAALEHIGFVNWNLPYEGATYAHIDDMPKEVAMAQAALLDMYQKLPDWTWSGGGRALKGLGFDPTTYVGGLAGLKFVRGLLAAGGKETTKGVLRSMLLRKALGASFVGAEGAGYTALSDYMMQKLEHGDAPDFKPDWNRVAVAAGGGYLFGAGLTGVLTNVPGIAKGVRQGVKATGRYIDETAKAAQQGALFSGVPIGGVDNRAGTSRLLRKDTSVIQTVAAGDKAKQKIAADTIRRLRERYPANQGWDKFEITGGTFKTEKGVTTFVPKFRQPAYAFHIPKGKAKYETHVQNISNNMVDDLKGLVDRAQNGDLDAQNIIAQSRWYRDVSQRLRKEFGGLGDVFADILGATSAQTNVRQNVENAVTILQRFSRGEFDKEIAAYAARKESGESMGSKTLHPLFQAGEFPLITKATGELFNANSPAATEALLGIFRDVKTGKAPKTLNFTKNILGIDDEATIDVWAARYLRDLAGLPRIIPGAEKAVAGKHLTGSTFEKSKVGSEFKFGQDVFSIVSKKINDEGLIKEIDPSIGDLAPQDLQAIAWFMEKEKWAKMGHPDIGGSMTDELALAGTADQARVRNLREIINQQQYSQAEKQAARTELESIEQPLQRTVLGVSPEREGAVPTNITMAETASAIDAPLRQQEAVVGYQLNNSYGRFKMGETDVTERSLNAEIVAREDFDPNPVMDALINTAKKYDQDSVFMAHVVAKNTPNAKPGTELFFKRRMPESFAEEVVTDLRELGVDGFTFVTDARQSDRVDVQALADPGATTGTAGLTGVRWIYVPDYDPKWPANGTVADQAKYLETVEDNFHDIMLSVLTKYSNDIATGNVLHFDVRTANKPQGGWK